VATLLGASPSFLSERRRRRPRVSSRPNVNPKPLVQLGVALYVHLSLAAFTDEHQGVTVIVGEEVLFAEGESFASDERVVLEVFEIAQHPVALSHDEPVDRELPVQRARCVGDPVDAGEVGEAGHDAADVPTGHLTGPVSHQRHQ